MESPNVKSWERVMDVVEEAPDVIILSVAPITSTRHRILLPRAGATYLVKIPPGKEILGTLLSETTSPNNLRLVTKKQKNKKKKVVSAVRTKMRRQSIDQ